MADNILGFKFRQNRRKMAFYRHVRDATNGFETNDVIEDWRHWLCSVARSLSLVGQHILFTASWKLLRLCIFQYLQRNECQLIYSVRKFSFCKIYTVFVGNLFYKLSHKKDPICCLLESFETF